MGSSPIARTNPDKEQIQWDISKILAFPHGNAANNYKGLYRDQPTIIPEKMDKKVALLCCRYMGYFESALGVTQELTMDELCLVTQWFQREVDSAYELIYFDTKCYCPFRSLYYGIDVAGVGGYSLLGEGLFTPHKGKPLYHLFCLVNDYFGTLLNSYSLFSHEETAKLFLDVLPDLNSCCPGCIEDEQWAHYNIYKIL